MGWWWGGVGEPGGGWGRAGASGTFLCPSLPSKTMGYQLREIRGWMGALWNHSLWQLPGGGELPQGWPPHSLQGLWSPLLCTFVEGRPEGCAWSVTRAPLLTQGLSHSRTTSSFLPPSPPASISLSLFLPTQSAPTLSTSMCLLRCVQPRCQPVEPRMGLWWERARCGLTECRWARWLSLEGKENLKISQ